MYVDDVWSGGTKEEAEDKKLPLLSNAIEGGLFHPNCKHSMFTYYYDRKKAMGKLQEDGVEVTPEEQEHRRNRLHIQQQKRLEEGFLDTQNIQEAKNKKEQWIEKDNKITGNKLYELYYSDEYDIRQKILKEEDAINTNNYETAIIFDKNGNVLLEKSGKEHEVEFSDDELLLFKDNIVSHNHPYDTTFSPNDVYMLKDWDAQEIRVTTSKKTFILRRNENIKKLPKYEDFENEYLQLLSKYSKAYIKKHPDWKNDRIRYQQVIQFNGFMEISNKYGLDYGIYYKKGSDEYVKKFRR